MAKPTAKQPPPRQGVSSSKTRKPAAAAPAHGRARKPKPVPARPAAPVSSSPAPSRKVKPAVKTENKVTKNTRLESIPIKTKQTAVVDGAIHPAFAPPANIPALVQNGGAPAPAPAGVK